MNPPKAKIPVDPSARLILEKYEAPHWIYSDRLKTPKIPTTPSLWFSFHFQKEAERYGPPILEKHRIEDNMPQVTPVHLNQDFFAAMLGHEKCGSTIWYAPEQRWYRSAGDYFTIATDEDLKLTLSQQLIRCCQDMAFFVDVEELFHTFRQEDALEAILQRATAVLAKDQEFFREGSGNKKAGIFLPEDAAKQFVFELLVENDQSWITVEDCFEAYGRFSSSRALPTIRRNCFRSTMNKAIQGRFSRSLRKDLLQFGAARGNGWKGVTLKEAIV